MLDISSSDPTYSSREEKAFLMTPKEEGSLWLGRCCSVVKAGHQLMRRYLIVATQVSLLTLNTIFLVKKITTDEDDGTTKITLLLLSTIGLLSTHYTMDIAWKMFQDLRFGLETKNWGIGALALSKFLISLGNVGMTGANFTAALEGVEGHPEQQIQIYRKITLMGEIIIGVDFFLTCAQLFVTHKAFKRLKEGFSDEQAAKIANALRFSRGNTCQRRERPEPCEEQKDNPVKFSSTLRFSMDKDTLWCFLDQLHNTSTEDCAALQEMLHVVKRNVQTQENVTLKTKIALIVIGDVLQVLEKIYTPNSLVSASINFGVSAAYAIYIATEKTLEFLQRRRLQNPIVI